MKTEKKKQEKCEVELDITLEASETQDIVARVERSFAQQVVLPGFRKGKVPIELIRKQFAQNMQQELCNEVLRKFLPDAVKAEGMELINVKAVSDFSCTREGGALTVKIDVKPTFTLPNYKGLVLGVKRQEITEADVDREIQRMREMHAKFEDAAEGTPVEDGDFVEIDYAGTVDGAQVTEVAPEAAPIAQGKGFWCVAGQDRPVPDVAKAVTGMKSGETKEGIEVDFSAFPAPEALKDKKGVYTVTVGKIRHRILPGDEELAKANNMESFEKLVSTMSEYLNKRSDSEYAQARRASAQQLLLQKVEFDLPESSVQNIQNTYLTNYMTRAQSAGLKADFFEANRDKIMEEAKAIAENTVKLYFLSEAIAKAEKIECEPKDVEEKVLEFVLSSATDEAK